MPRMERQKLTTSMTCIGGVGNLNGRVGEPGCLKAHRTCPASIYVPTSGHGQATHERCAACLWYTSSAGNFKISTLYWDLMWRAARFVLGSGLVLPELRGSASRHTEAAAADFASQIWEARSRSISTFSMCPFCLFRSVLIGVRSILYSVSSHLAWPQALSDSIPS